MEKDQRELFILSHNNLMRGNEAMLDLLFGVNPISDDELRALILKRPHVYSRFAVFLGKR